MRKFVTCSQDVFMELFDEEDFVKSFNGGNVDMYQIGECIGYVEEINGVVICMYSVNKGEE